MKSVLITGAFGGMGYTAAKLMAEKGYKVFALDKEVRPTGKNIIPVHADATCEESIMAAYAKICETENELHAIIHFAGIYMLDSLAEMSPSDFRRIFDINLHSAFLINRTFLPLLKNGSRIIITTSELAPLDPLPFTGIYAVTKAALDKYAYSLAMELQLLGISVSVLRAGAVSTNMLGASTAALDKFCASTNLYSCNAERFRKIVDSVEARNIPPEKIAGKVLGIMEKKNPPFSNSINRNPLLLLLNALPKSLQLKIIRIILR